MSCKVKSKKMIFMHAAAPLLITNDCTRKQVGTSRMPTNNKKKTRQIYGKLDRYTIL